MVLNIRAIASCRSLRIGSEYRISIGNGSESPCRAGSADIGLVLNSFVISRPSHQVVHLGSSIPRCLWSEWLVSVITSLYVLPSCVFWDSEELLLDVCVPLR